MTEEEKRDAMMQSADKYDKFDTGNSQVDHLGEIGDMLDEGDEEKQENIKAQKEAMEAQRRKQMESRMVAANPRYAQHLNGMNRVRHHQGQMGDAVHHRQM